MNQALTQSPNRQVASVRDFLNQPAVKKQIVAALPKHLTPERMIRVITTAITNTPKLAECTRDSLVAAIVEATTLGLEPNTSLGEAYLIPYGKQAKLIIGYRGFLAMARRSGEISYAVSEIVFANDLFKVTLGTSREIIHEPLLTGDRGAKIGVYSLVIYRDGSRDFEYMTASDVEKIKNRSKASNDGPWKTDENEMWRKTPMRRHAKRWPLSAEDRERVMNDEYTDYGIANPGEHIPEPPTVISQEQRESLVAAARRSKLNNPATAKLVESFGFKTMSAITVDRYDDILSAINSAGAVDGTPEPEPNAEPEPEVAENVSDVAAESEDDSVRKQLIHSLEEKVFEVGELQLSRGQRTRYGNRANLKADDLQSLIDEITK